LEREGEKERKRAREREEKDLSTLSNCNAAVLSTGPLHIEKWREE
jgi:hypothetical protein